MRRVRADPPVDRATIHKFNNLPPDEKAEATRRELNVSATGKPYPENVKPHRVS